MGRLKLLLRLSITSVKPLRAGMASMRHSPCLSQATSPGGGHTNMSVCSSSTTRGIDLHSKHSQRSRRPKNARDCRQADCHTLKSLPLPLCCLRQNDPVTKTNGSCFPFGSSEFSLSSLTVFQTPARAFLPKKQPEGCFFFFEGPQELSGLCPSARA